MKKSLISRANNAIKVSILVPCCNVEKFLRQCLDSIINQTLRDIEIICINDGSRDGTLDIINEYADKDERIRVIDKPNSGYGDSMNQGLNVACGEYIGIVESDDYIEPEMYETLYSTAQEFKAEIVKSNFWLYWEHNGVNDLYECLPKKECGKVIIPSEYNEGQLYKVKPSIWSAIYNREFLANNKIAFLPTPGASYQDTSFTFKAFSCCKRFVAIPDAFLHYRQDNAGSSVNNADKKANFVCEEYAEISRYISDGENKETLYPIYAATFYDACIWMYEKLSVLKRYKFLKTISPLFKKIIEDIGADNIYFGSAWWKRRDIKRIANDPFEYHMWRNVERYEQSGGKIDYKDTVTPLNNYTQLLKLRQEADSAEPTFSVIVPVYNCEKYLPSCLESLLFQTADNFEIVCINDGSSDHSLAVVEEYAALDKRIIVVNKQNEGPAEARNVGIDLARGKFILFLDSDDYYSENAIERLNKVVSSEIDIDAVLFGTNIFPDEPRASDWHYSVLTTPDRFFKTIDQKTLLTTPYLKVYAWRFCYRREFLNSNKLRFATQYKYGEDAIFVLTALPKVSGLVCVSDKLYNYRHFRPDSLMNQINRDYITYTMEQLRALEAIIDVSEREFGSTSIELFEYSCDFIYSCITNCPEPKRSAYIRDFVRLIKRKNLSRFADRASDNSRGFWEYCVHRVKELKSIRLKLKKVKRLLAKFLPLSRRIFQDRMQVLQDIATESKAAIFELQTKILDLQSICQWQNAEISELKEIIKSQSDDNCQKKK